MTESDAIKAIQLDICNECECIENCIKSQCEYFLAINALEKQEKIEEIEIATKSLKKQIPNKVKEYGICPECNYDFGMEKVNYCPNCGQRLEE